MDRNALQQNRDPIGYTKRTRRPKKELKTTGSECSSDEGSVSVSESPLQLSPPPISPVVLKPRRSVLQVLTDREKTANNLRLSDYLPIRSLQEALCSKSLLNDAIFMSKWGTPSDRHQMKELRRVCQDDYHYWNERDWFLLTEYAKTFEVFEALDYHDKVSQAS